MTSSQRIVSPQVELAFAIMSLNYQPVLRQASAFRKYIQTTSRSTETFRSLKLPSSFLFVSFSFFAAFYPVAFFGCHLLAPFQKARRNGNNFPDNEEYLVFGLKTSKKIVVVEANGFTCRVVWKGAGIKETIGETKVNEAESSRVRIEKKG